MDGCEIEHVYGDRLKSTLTVLQPGFEVPIQVLRVR